MQEMFLLVKKRVVNAIFLLLLFPGMLMAQELKTVTGTVTDASGAPIQAASVKVKGAKGGTTTNASGVFSIKAKDGDVIVISAVSFGTKEITVGSQTNYNVSLEATSTNLNDVVVVGYGKGSKKTLSSSITSVKAEELNRGAISDVGQLLQGKVPGLNITASGDPNKTAAVILRGASTLNSGSGVFYVIDGVPGADIATVALMISLPSMY